MRPQCDKRDVKFQTETPPNFVRIHKTLRVTPAIAAGVIDKLWEIADIVALIEAKEAEKPTVRGSYNKRGIL